MYSALIFAVAECKYYGTTNKKIAGPTALRLYKYTVHISEGEFLKSKINEGKLKVPAVVILYIIYRTV